MPDSQDCLDARIALKARKDAALTNFDEAYNTVTNLVSKIATKRDTYTSGTACYNYFESWRDKVVDLRNAVEALFTDYRSQIIDPQWGCGGTTWRNEVNSYQADVEAMESCVKQMRDLTVQMQKRSFAPTTFTCLTVEPEFRDPVTDVLQSRCALMLQELKDKKEAILAPAVTMDELLITKMALLLLTRKTFTPNSECWLYYNEWYTGVFAIFWSNSNALGALIAKIDTNYDCIYDDHVFIKHENNLKIVDQMKILVDAYVLNGTKVKDNGLNPRQFSCKQKPTP